MNIDNETYNKTGEKHNKTY